MQTGAADAGVAAASSLLVVASFLGFSLAETPLSPLPPPASIRTSGVATATFVELGAGGSAVFSTTHNAGVGSASAAEGRVADVAEDGSTAAAAAVETIMGSVTPSPSFLSSSVPPPSSPFVFSGALCGGGVVSSGSSSSSEAIVFAAVAPLVVGAAVGDCISNTPLPSPMIRQPSNHVWATVVRRVGSAYHSSLGPSSTHQYSVCDFTPTT
mmetsp:Transcript_19773/g.27836  ORF Transcript_19773/g.27836 Transcript_19773/m.27836 type:complete len:212 (+) Transcript_19773:375-1010(+)